MGTFSGIEDAEPTECFQAGGQVCSSCARKAKSAHTAYVQAVNTIPHGYSLEGPNADSSMQVDPAQDTHQQGFKRPLPQNNNNNNDNHEIVMDGGGPHKSRKLSIATSVLTSPSVSTSGPPSATEVPNMFQTPANSRSFLFQLGLKKRSTAPPPQPNLGTSRHVPPSSIGKPPELRLVTGLGQALVPASTSSTIPARDLDFGNTTWPVNAAAAQHVSLQHDRMTAAINTIRKRFTKKCGVCYAAKGAIEQHTTFDCTVLKENFCCWRCQDRQSGLSSPLSGNLPTY